MPPRTRAGPAGGTAGTVEAATCDKPAARPEPGGLQRGGREEAPVSCDWCGAVGEQVEQVRREQSRSRAARIDDLVALCSVAAQVAWRAPGRVSRVWNSQVGQVKADRPHQSQFTLLVPVPRRGGPRGPRPLTGGA